MERKEDTEKAMKRQGQKLKLGSHSQGNPEASRSWKRQERILPLELSEGTQLHFRLHSRNVKE